MSIRTPGAPPKTIAKLLAITLFLLGTEAFAADGSECKTPGEAQSITAQHLREFRDQRFKGPLAKIRQYADAFLHAGGRATYFGDLEGSGDRGVRDWVEQFKTEVNEKAAKNAKSKTGKEIDDLPFTQRLEFTRAAWKEVEGDWTKRIFETMKAGTPDDALAVDEILKLSKRERKRAAKDQIKDAQKRIEKKLTPEEFLAFLMVHRSESDGFDGDPVVTAMKNYLHNVGDVKMAVKNTNPKLDDIWDSTFLLFPQLTRAWRLEPRIKVPMGPVKSIDEFAERLAGLAIAMDRSARRPTSMAASAYKALTGVAYIDNNGRLKSDSLIPFVTYYRDFAGKLRRELQVRADFKRSLYKRRGIKPDMAEVEFIRANGFGAWLVRKNLNWWKNREARRQYLKQKKEGGALTQQEINEQLSKEYNLEIEKAAAEMQIAFETAIKRPALKVFAGTMVYLTAQNCSNEDLAQCAVGVVAPELILLKMAFETPYKIWRARQLAQDYETELSACKSDADCVHNLLYGEDAEIFRETDQLINETKSGVEKKSFQEVQQRMMVLNQFLRQEKNYTNLDRENMNELGLDLLEWGKRLAEACSSGKKTCGGFTKVFESVNRTLKKVSDRTGYEYPKDIRELNDE